MCLDITCTPSMHIAVHISVYDYCACIIYNRYAITGSPRHSKRDAPCLINIPYTYFGLAGKGLFLNRSTLLSDSNFCCL